MNQTDQSKHFGIKRSYFNGIIRGKRRPGIALAQKLSKELGIDFFKLRPDLKKLLKELL